MNGSLLRAAALAFVLAVTACNGLYLGDNPGREFPKQTGPLTTPPATALNGTARDLSR